ncbi:MAG: MmcQ/YjbR family DNA-binding protein [Bacteroidetes bacterium]|nr:MmcQ/YjbR family DNA-binding protein [Bacteroidota bacterium]
MDIEKLRDTCLSFPGTSEGIKYGEQLCFMVAGKVFCSSNLKNLDLANFKVGDEEFEGMCDRPGIVAAPYGGAKFKWVQVTDFGFLSEKEWAHCLRNAYGLVKAKLPKKVQVTLG